MGRFAKVIKAFGLGLQVMADAASQEAEDGPVAGFMAAQSLGHSVETEPIEAMNPYLELDSSQWIFEALDHQAMALWPVVHISPAEAVTSSYILASGLMTVHTQDNVTARRGLAFETARLVASYFDEDTDPDGFPGPDDKRPVAEGNLDVRPHMAAFFDAALSGDLEAAVRVSDVVATEGHNLWQNLTQEAQERKIVLYFLAGIVASVSRKWSVDQVPELLGIETGADDED